MQALGMCAYKVRLWWLWLACSFRFRWAHRPLCSRFRSGIVRTGGIHLCRSCLCAYCGILACALSLVLLRPSVTQVGMVLAGIGTPTLALSGPWCYTKFPRAARDVLRLTMGAVIALCGYLLLCRELMVAVPVAVVLFVFWRAYFRVRRAQRLRACDGCEELSDKGICSGCRLQTDGARRYEQIATQLYLASGQTPTFPPSPQGAGLARSAQAKKAVSVKLAAFSCDRSQQVTTNNRFTGT